MSEQVDGFLQIKPSYNYQRNKVAQYKNNSIQPVGFHNWAKDHMYKSSYAHFHSKDSVEPKATVMPGYGGYIPYVKPQNIHAKRYSSLAKQSFQNTNLAKLNGVATTGFNLKKQMLIDQSKIASSSKYGKTALQKPHPGWDAEWKSTTQDFYRNPQALVNPCYRETDKWLQTQKQKTKGSGYATNHAFFDGNGWKPNPILNGDNNRTEYRDRFNASHDFHRNVYCSKAPKLPHKQMNYHLN